MQRIAVDISPDTVLECFSKHLMAKIRPHWSKEKARIKKFEGGYSNYLIGLSQEGGDDSDIVLIRIDHAALSEFFADRDAEVTVMNSLHSSGWNPPVYCQFNNAICYGYAPGRPLSLDDLTNPVILGEIAKTMARYHSINIDIDGVDWVQTILQSLPVSLPDDEVSSAMVSTIGSWDYLMQEFKKAKATMVSFKSPLVLCHNDVHVLNMIYDEVHGKVTFIDHEAAGISHLAKEIGNFFRYFVGIFENLDFSRFPSEQVQKEFIRNYLKERHTLMTNGNIFYITKIS